MYVKNPNARVLRNGNKVLLCNTRNGGFVRVTEGYYELLEYFLTQDSEYELSGDSVRENVDRLIDALIKVHFLVDDKHYEEELSFPYQIIYLSLTNKCNLRCKHCIVEGGIEKNKELCTRVWKEVIDQVIKLNPKEINVTGGEPLLRYDLEEILSYLRGVYGGMITLSTNGLLVNEQIAKVIKENVDAVAISLDGFDKKSCEKIRGVNVFDKVINAITLLKKTGIGKIALSMLNTRYTYQHLDEFYDLCNQLAVKPVVRRFTPGGRGATFQDELLPPIKSEIPETKAAVNCRLCRPGEKELSIIENGDAYPCVPLSGNVDFKMGNIMEESLEQIIKEAHWRENIEKVRPWITPRCEECPVNLFCHDCVSYIQSIMARPELIDEFCTNKKKQLESILWEE